MTQDRCRCRSPHEGAAPSLSGPAHVPSGIAWSTGVGDEPANLSEACARVSAGRLLASTPARPVFGTWAFCERAGVRGCTGPRVGCAPVCRLRGGMLTAPCARPAPCTRARGKRPHRALISARGRSPDDAKVVWTAREVRTYPASRLCSVLTDRSCGMSCRISASGDVDFPDSSPRIPGPDLRP